MSVINDVFTDVVHEGAGIIASILALDKAYCISIPFNLSRKITHRCSQPSVIVPIF